MNPFFDNSFSWTLSAVSSSDFTIGTKVKLLGSLTKTEIRLRLAQDEQSELSLEAAYELRKKLVGWPTGTPVDKFIIPNKAPVLDVPIQPVVIVEPGSRYTFELPAAPTDEDGDYPI